MKRMKRDIDLIKLLLREVEGEEPKPDLSGYSQEQILYHYELMEEAGLVVAHFERGAAGQIIYAGVERLTNLGHDFLDASRSDTVWAKFKQAVAKVGGSISIPVAVELMKQLVKTELGL
jgi:hypothetical protein